MPTTNLNIAIRDVTLREGEDALGRRLRHQQRWRLTESLIQAGIRNLDVGYVGEDRQMEKLARKISSKAQISLSALVKSWDPKWRKHVETCASAGITQIDVLFYTSDIQLKSRLLSRKILRQGLVRERLGYVESQGCRPCVGAVDSTRAPLQRLLSLASAAQRENSGMILYDTVGIGRPNQIYQLVSQVRRILRNVTIHCHNDLGLATANTLTGIEAGANIADTSVLGIGDRAGNASLEQVILGLKLLYHANVQFKMRLIPELCHLASKFFGLTIPRDKPIVGREVFARHANIHKQSSESILSWLPFDPALVGLSPIQFRTKV
jgi:homocitrate synthase NifV